MKPRSLARFSLAIASLLTSWAVAAPPAHYRLADCDKALLAKVKAGPKFLLPNAVGQAQGYPDDTVTMREIEDLLQWQAQRTAQDVKRIRSEAGDLVPAFLRALDVNPAQHAKTVALLRAALVDVDYFLFAEKFRLLRPRPHQVDPRIHPAIAVPRHPAYPSGHGGESRAMALLMAELVPGLAPRATALASAVGHRREIAGVHFPSDTEAGARIGDAVVEKLLLNNAFRKLLTAARQELAGR